MTYKNFVETFTSKFCSSSICKYNLLRKAEILLESFYRPGKVSTLLQVQELGCRKCIPYKKKENVYHKLE